MMSIHIAIRRDVASTEDALGEASPGETVKGLEENTWYLITVFRISGLPGSEIPSAATKLFVDDIEVTERRGEAFRWGADFFAGTVSAIVAEASGAEHAFFLEVEPAQGKAGPEQFKEMLTHIRAFDVAMLTGASGATRKFGHEGRPAKLALLAQLARLQQYGPTFLAAAGAIAASPHQTLQASTHTLRLSQVRRLHPSALRDRRLAALTGGQVVQGEQLESLQLLAHGAAVTSNTPANQAMGALLTRFRARAVALLNAVLDQGLGENEAAERTRRQPRRQAVLEHLVAQTEKLLRGRPFRDLNCMQTTSAGFTQISAKPAYSRAYRCGIQALRSGIEGDINDDSLRILPSWGVYETWCYVEVVRQLTDLTGVSFEPARSQTASADVVRQALLANGTHLEVLCQATFNAVDVKLDRLARTLSRERRPDIVLVAERAGQRKYLVFDAKWRSARERILEAMESAHVYHDALRIENGTPEGVRPDICLLLSPGNPVVPALEDPAFWNSHGVGVVSEVLPGAGGLARCRSAIASWLYP